MFSARLLAAALLAAAAMPAAAAPLLVPHRAVYDLELDKATDRSGITGLSGRMVYEFHGGPCEGYTVKFRFVTRIATSENSRLTDQQTTTFEDGEGKNFSFVTKSYVDQNLDKEVKGTATREPDKLEVKIDKPQREDIDLDKTQFPTQHLMELIGKASEGQTFYETSLFDGSEDADKVMTTTVVVGKQAEAQADDPELKALQNLSNEKYWPVDIAYFNPIEGEASGEETPEYHISFKLHANGLTRDLTMDYGDFSMKGKLVDLKLFDPAKEGSCTR